MDLCYYTGHERVPSVATYRYPSEAVGMTQRRAGTAAAGLTASLFAVEVPSDDHPIGMGRVIRDGERVFFQVSDIVEVPAHRRRGAGRAIMSRITTYLRTHAPDNAYINLITDGGSHYLHRKFGFVATAHGAIGMRSPLESR